MNALPFIRKGAHKYYILSFQKGNRDIFPARMAEKLFEHKVHFEVKVFFCHEDPPFGGFCEGLIE